MELQLGKHTHASPILSNETKNLNIKVRIMYYILYITLLFGTTSRISYYIFVSEPLLHLKWHLKFRLEIRC